MNIRDFLRDFLETALTMTPLGLILGPMMCLAQPLRVFGVAAIFAGIGVSFSLRKQTSELVLLYGDPFPSQDEADAVIAKYDSDFGGWSGLRAAWARCARSVSAPLARLLLRTAKVLAELSQRMQGSQSR